MQSEAKLTRCRSRTSTSSCRGRCRSSSARRRARSPASYRRLAIVSEPSPPTVIRASMSWAREQADELLGAVDLDPRAVRLLHRVGRRVARFVVPMIVPPWWTMPRTDSRVSGTTPPCGYCSGLHQAVEAVADADDVPAAVAGGERGGPDDGVEPGASPPPVLMAIRLMSSATRRTVPCRLGGSASLRVAARLRTRRRRCAQRSTVPSRASAGDVVEAVDGLDHGVEAAAAEHGTLAADRRPGRCRAAGRPWRSSAGPAGPTARLPTSTWSRPCASTSAPRPTGRRRGGR